MLTPDLTLDLCLLTSSDIPRSLQQLSSRIGGRLNLGERYSTESGGVVAQIRRVLSDSEMSAS
jgi:hypothetical protein